MKYLFRTNFRTVSKATRASFYLLNNLSLAWKLSVIKWTEGESHSGWKVNLRSSSKFSSFARNEILIKAKNDFHNGGGKTLRNGKHEISSLLCCWKLLQIWNDKSQKAHNIRNSTYIVLCCRIFVIHFHLALFLLKRGRMSISMTCICVFRRSACREEISLKGNETTNEQNVNKRVVFVCVHSKRARKHCLSISFFSSSFSFSLAALAVERELLSETEEN